MKIKYFDQFEIRAFFKAVLKARNEVRDLLLFRFAYHYGLRVSELAAIRLSDLKPDPLKAVEIEIHRGKGGISRHYPLGNEDARLLRRWITERSRMVTAKDNEWLFISRQSRATPISKIGIQKLHEKYFLAAWFPKERSTNVHMWRHSCAISLLMSGRDVWFVKNFLGHRSIQSTMVYAELAPPQWAQLSRQAINNSFID